jgi:uncharacterized lipoprotein NlpE involved in copper resistance
MLLKLKQIILFSASLLLAINAFAEEDVQNYNDHPKIEWSGVYYGFTPCEDCKGVKTTLALNGNNETYILMQQYIGKSEREFTEKGKFEWNPDTKVLMLTARNNGNIHYYEVNDNALTQLNNRAQPINTKDAKEALRYVLHKNEMIEKAGKSASHGRH